MRAPVEDLVDLDSLRRDGRPPTPSEIRAALPRGWVLDEDGETARRDGRLLFREGWMLVLAMVFFGSAAFGLFWMSFPSGAGPWLRLILGTALILLVGGLVAPQVTRALNRR